MRRLALIPLFVVTAAAVAIAGGHAQSTQDLLTSYPGVQIYESAGQPQRLYGTVFGVGESPEISAANFVSEHADIFGLTPEELIPGRPSDGQLTQPVMYDADTQTYKFTLIYYTQHRDGLPVYESELRLLVRNEPDYPLVWAGSTLRDLSNFRVEPDQTRSPAIGLALAAALRFEPSLANFTPAELIVWAGTADELSPPRAALTFVADNEMTGSETPQRWRMVADASTGKLLHTEDLILFTDVVGTVSGQVTEGNVAEDCADEVPTPLPYIEVLMDGGDSVFADSNGQFTVPYEGTEEVSLTCYVGGLLFDVTDSALLSKAAVPPGPVDFLHNQINLQNTRAEVNAYYQANVVHMFALQQNPSYPVLEFQTNFTINVNLTGGYCPGNAWYSGSSINFCLGSGTYPNTAFGSVVHHEYGHHMVGSGGSGQGAYGEGMADSVAALIADDPVLGVGFTGDCGTGLRNADNDFQYPCNGEIHYCGQLLSGCIWSTRCELAATNPDDYMEIISSLAVNSIFLHTGTEITPQITIRHPHPR